MIKTFEKDSGTVSISYSVEKRAGPWITLVNGHTRPASDFRALTRLLTEKGYSVLTMDNRGAGGTRSGEFGLEDMVQDIIDLWFHESIEESSLLGISMGGVIAQLLVETSPERVSSLILVSTTCDTKRLVPRPDQPDWEQSLPELQRKLELYVHPDFAARNKVLIKAMANQLLKRYSDFKTGAAAQRKAITGLATNLGVSQSNLQIPALIFHGKDDGIIAVDAAFELLNKYPQSSMKIYGKTGHLLLAEQGRYFFQEVVNFLSLHIPVA